eukprot:TRINITY_DN2351_c0_g1_i2.p2 TRINITY_DN2351_c0_g1~~TRINITY_DN2351_c0_g1_i2.p2  ORF type:complete len:167 (+),score=22.78 TRINITY_DN2351_c0_g1_i2:112-612(+)
MSDNSFDNANIGKTKTKITIDYCIWFTQLLLWNFFVFLSKILLLGVQAMFAALLVEMSAHLWSSLDNMPNFKLLIVMVIVPVIMNSFQFWIQDNFLKKQEFDKEDVRLMPHYYEEVEMTITPPRDMQKIEAQITRCVKCRFELFVQLVQPAKVCFICVSLCYYFFI